MNSHTTTPAAGQVALSAFRFSDDPGRFGSFLELLGLGPVVSNDDNTWLELVGASGRVSVHGTAATGIPTALSGTTDLVVVTTDVTALATSLERVDGVTVDVWDEAFGRQATVTLASRKITINEIQNDLYGYQAHSSQPGPITVVVHWHTENVDTVRDLLALFGFTTNDASTAATQRFTAPDDVAGVVILHRSDRPDRFELGLETEEAIEQVAERLRRSSHQPTDVSSNQLTVDDPDGQPITVAAVGSR